jgi:hypothetical protein
MGKPKAERAGASKSKLSEFSIDWLGHIVFQIEILSLKESAEERRRFI